MADVHLLFALLVSQAVVFPAAGNKDKCAAYRGPREVPQCSCDFGCSKDTSAHSNPALHTYNVAYGQKALARSIKGSSPLACAVVNGRTTNRLCKDVDFVNKRCPAVNCIKTGQSDQQPWFLVQLDRPYTVSQVQIHGERDSWANMAGVQVEIEAQLCFAFVGYGTSMNDLRHLYLPANSSAPRIYNATCSEPVKGRILTVRKTRYIGKLKNYQLAFCEVQVWVCDQGYYGDPVNGVPCRLCPSPRHCKYDCDNVHGCRTEVTMNVALYKRPDIRTSSDSAPASVVLDGETLADGQPFCAETLAGSGDNRFTVVLGGLFAVRSVAVTGRSDCCYEALDQFRVYVTEKLSYQEGLYGGLCVDFKSQFIGETNTRRLNCRPGLTGRFVSLYNRNYSRLILCEFQVFGYELNFDLQIGENCSFRCEVSRCDPDSSGLCQEGKCRLPVGNDCSGGLEHLCVEGGACEEGTCRLKPHEYCGWSKEDICPSNTECQDYKSGLKKCLSTLGGTCATDDECGSDLGCDPMKTCKKGSSAKCKVNSECAAGAQCVQAKCQCVNSVGNRTVCSPSPGHVGGACGNETQCVRFAECDSSHRCVCAVGYQPVHDFTCKLSAGSTCQDQSSCGKGLLCEDNKCKVPAGKKCAHAPDDCDRTSICDVKSNMCSLLVGQTCSNPRILCRPGALCQKSVCKYQLGERCGAHPNLCKVGSKCVSVSTNISQCRLVAGQSCEKGQETCVPSATCGTDNKCKLNPGQKCNGTTKGLCRSDSECSNHRCVLKFGEKCNSSATHYCASSTVCDYSKTCRLKEGQPCSNTSVCTLGANCTDNTCRCIPEVSTLNSQSGMCEPKDRKVGGRCGASEVEPCDDFYALCTKTTPHSSAYSCQCVHGFSADNDNSCRGEKGIQCNSDLSGLDNFTSPCVVGTVCEDNECKLMAGQSCEPRLAGECRYGTVCDTDNICRLQSRSDCSEDSSLCQRGTVCDAVKECKVAVDQRCVKDEHCVAGAECVDYNCQCVVGVSKPSGQDPNTICELVYGKVGGPCDDETGCEDPHAVCQAGEGSSTSNSTCVCPTGFRIDGDTLSCRRLVGQACGEDVTDICEKGTVCDRRTKICRVVLGKRCAGETSTLCVMGTVCDEETFTCRLAKYAECQVGAEGGNCVSGTVCDALGSCKSGRGIPCDSTDNCIAGGICYTNFTCECNLEVASPRGSICVPLPGRAGARCDVTNRCLVPHSTCEDRHCRCKLGFKAYPENLTCRVNLVLSTKNKVMFVVIVLSLTFMIAAFLVVLLMVNRYRHAQEPELETTRPDWTLEKAGEIMAKKREEKQQIWQDPQSAFSALQSTQTTDAVTETTDSELRSTSITASSAFSESQAFSSLMGPETTTPDISEG